MALKFDVQPMKTAAVAKAVSKTQEESGSGLSNLSRILLKASYQEPTLSGEAKAKARSEAFATLIKSMEPRNI